MHEKSRALYTANQELQTRADELALSLERLRETQDQLVESAKLASLGRLVAGVSHEINTPLGVSMMAVAHGGEALKKLQSDFNSGRLSKSGFMNCVADCDEALQLAERNLNRSAELVKSFKRLAVDQSSEQLRFTTATELVQDCIASLRPFARRSRVDIDLSHDEGLKLLIDAGALVQVVTNLIQNALIHAFGQTQDERQVSVRVTHATERLMIVISDNGAGMSDAVQRQVFEPFFTTRRSEGGSGLGTHIVHNLVTQRFGGTIELDSSIGSGSRWTLTLPYGSRALMSGDGITSATRQELIAREIVQDE